MKWIGQHIWDLTSRFRNDIYFEGLAETEETRGLVVDANGKVSINPLSGDEHATHVYENVRNDEGATIPVGTPVYSKGEVGGSERILVGIADASDPAKMPAIGITNTELTTTGDTKDGLITLVGVYNTNLSGFSGVSENDIVYVASGGGLTITKPTGVNLIQNIGIVLKTNGPGTIIQGLAVTCIGRTNDVPTPLYIDHANQRLGIGTTSPTRKLDVAGDMNLASSAVALRIGGTAVLGILNNYTRVNGTGGANGGILFTPNDDNTEKMRIDSSGNVGIGTTSPSQKLHVIGDARIQGNLTVNGTYTQIDTDVNTTEQWLVTNDGTGPAAVINQLGTEDIFDVQDDGTSVLYVKDGGNVGIGTTSPTKKLEVNGEIQGTNVYAETYRSARTDGDLYIQAATATDFVAIGTQTSPNLVRIDGGGNVGIGTTSPAAGLQVALGGTTIPAAGASTASAVFGNSTSDNNYGVAIGANSSGVGYISSQRTDGTATTYNLAIQPNGGNVGIGTDSPSSKLHVAGEITTEDQINFKNFGGSLLRFTKDSWTSAPNHDLIYQGWDTTIDDYIYLKAPGNTTTTHGVALIGDGVIALGRTDAETGAPELTSAAAPLDDNWLVLNSTGATFSGNIAVSGTVDGVDIGANYANWNTAYSWGNHASAGYLTSSSTQSKYLRSDAVDYFTGKLNWDGADYTDGINMSLGNIRDAHRIDANEFFQSASGRARNNLGDPTVTEMALFEEQFKPQTTLANDYDDLTDLTFWYQETSSSSWVEDTSYSDDQKRKFLRTNNSSVIIPNTYYKFRVEFKAKSYTFANAMYMYWSSQSHNTQVHVWKKRCSDGTWLQHTSSTNTISSWPGHGYLPFSKIAWHETNTTSTGHFTHIRFEFTPNWIPYSGSGTDYSTRNINLYGMQIWGGYPSGRRTPHYYDQNGEFNFLKDAHIHDNQTLYIGTGGDLQIYHDGSNSYIDDVGTGNLKIRSNRLQLEKYTGETMAEFIADGASSLYYDNNKKFETTSTGVDVTGNVTSSGYYYADTHFQSTDSNATLSAIGGGGVYLRPNGAFSTTGQFIVHHTTGNVDISGNLTINNTYPRIFLTDSNHNDDWSIINNDGKFGIYNDTDTSYALSIDGSNNVGIGTTSPDTKLHVDGDLTISGTAPTLRIQDSRNLNNPDWDSVSLGNIEFYTSDTTSPGARVLAEIEAFSNNAAASGPNADLIFKTSAIADSSPQTRLTIGYDGTSTFAGNVTAGSNSLTAGSLDINGNADISGSLTTTGTVSGTTLYGNHPDGNGLSLKLGRADNSNYWEFNHAGNDLRIYNSASSGSDILLGVNAGGTAQANNVGIGTATPAVKLDVAGDAQLQGTAPRFVMKETGTNKDFSLRVQTDGRFSVLNDNLASEVLVIKQDGNVGIGTTSPSEKLEVDGNIKIGDSDEVRLGAGNDLRIYHNGTNSNIENFTGTLQIVQTVDDEDITFRCDDGSGGTTPYITIDGSATRTNVHKDLRFDDNIGAVFGSGAALKLHSDGSNGIIDNFQGNLIIRQQVDDADIAFQCDDGSGGVETYFFLDGGSVATQFNKNTLHPDGVRARFGSSADMYINHDGTNSYIENETGNLYILNRSDDKDIVLQSDDGTGSLTTYMTIDGGNTQVQFAKSTNYVDGIHASFGSGGDLKISHNGTNSTIENETGNLYILNDANDGDIVFQSDDGSGGTTEYFRVDGGEGRLVHSVNSRYLDGVVAMFGTGGDLQIYHDGSNSYIKDGGTGSLNISSNQLNLNASNGENGIQINENAEVKIRHNNIVKLATTSTGVDVTGNISLTGSVQKQIQVFPMNFVDDLGTDKHFMPFVTNTEQTVVYQEEAAMVMPADGRVVSVTVHYAQMDGTDGNITVGIETSACGQSYANPWTVEETETIAASVADDHHVFHFAFDNAKHFESTDKMAISIQQSTDMQSAARFFWVTAVVEYDWSTFLGGTSAEYTTTP